MKTREVEIIKKRSRDRVYGFLSSKGKTIVNGKGQEILLTGWGLGNWLLNEGYMWRSFANQRFDRPRRIEGVIEELTGKAYKDYFLKAFREHYFTEEDIRNLSDLGYNSIRIPIYWRLLMEENDEITFIEEGFELIDRCLDWCEKYKMYAFIDMHGAPGGQTGANIDDSIDDIPRLFMDDHSYKQCIELWKAIALRYKDRYIVGGYDLLNEPIRPGNSQIKSYDYLLPNLKAFYEEVISEIRKIDQKHMFSIEGHHWSTDTAVFDRLYDPNMVIHFHRYGCNPDYQAYEEFLKLSEKWDLPLWLGESGENKVAWFTAMFPLALDLNIGYNLWPAKKMDATNSPYSIKQPKEWDKILSYLEGGPHPGYKESRKIFDEYLENIKFKNCIQNHEVTAAVFRKPGTKLMGVDFDELPGKGLSYQYTEKHNNQSLHRKNTGMEIISKGKVTTPHIGFYNGWDLNTLGLSKNEFACYTFTHLNKDCIWEITIEAIEAGELIIYEDQVELKRMTFDVEKKKERLRLQSDCTVLEKQVAVLKIEVLKGKVEINSIELLMS